MSVRVDCCSLITGAVVLGEPGLGVSAESIAATGEHGGGIASTWLDSEDAGKEIRVLITSWPLVGALFVFEDSSFKYDGPSTTFTAQLFVDGETVGTPQTVTLAVGGAAIDLAPSSLIADSVTTSVPLVGSGIKAPQNWK